MDPLITVEKSAWLLRPVIGEIKGTKAVILLKPKDKNISLSLSLFQKDNDENTVFYPKIYIEDSKPTRLVVQFPSAGKYQLRWASVKDVEENKVESLVVYVHEIVIKEQMDKMIFVSCDFLEADTKHSMWDVMGKEIKGKSSVSIFHLGGQAYMDATFNKGVRIAGECDENAKQKIMDMFAKRYQETWEPHHYILSHTSNYCIWDDHEIKNDITLTESLPKDADFVRSMAVESYKNYQQSLHLEFSPILSEYSWVKKVGTMMIIAIERTSVEVPVKDIISVVSVEDKITRLILCFSSAPIPKPKGKYGAAYETITGDDGKGKKSKFWPENKLLELYSGLFDWMDKVSNREVLVAGGDLHFGTYGVMMRATKCIPVIISSPITSEPTPERWMASKGMKGLHVLSHAKSPIIFTTVSSKAKRCYAVVDLRGATFDVRMEYAKEKHPRSVKDYYKTMIQMK